MPSTPAEKYATQMYRLARGLALFDPSPGKYIEAGQRLRKPRVEIGDLGYIAPEGTFHLLFNVHRQADDPLQIHGVPIDFQPLDRVDRLIDYREERITPQHLRSTTGVEVDLAANVSVPIVGGISSTFSFDYECGATLAYFDHHETLKAQNLVHYANHFEEHFTSWLDFARFQGIPVTLDQLFLVTGCERTRAWATLLAERRSAGGSLGLEAQTIGPGIAITASVRWRNTNGEQARSGPPPAELLMRSEDVVTSVASQSAQSLRPDTGRPILDPLSSDQCIFIKGFRGRSGLLNIWKPYKAAAGPHTLPRGDNDGSSSPGLGLIHDPDGEDETGVEDEHGVKMEPDVKSEPEYSNLEEVPGSSLTMDRDPLSLALEVIAEYYAPVCKNNLLLMHDDDLVPFLPKPGDADYTNWNTVEHARSYLIGRLKTSPPANLRKTEAGWEQHIEDGNHLDGDHSMTSTPDLSTSNEFGGTSKNDVLVGSTGNVLLEQPGQNQHPHPYKSHCTTSSLIPASNYVSLGANPTENASNASGDSLRSIHSGGNLPYNNPTSALSRGLVRHVHNQSVMSLALGSSDIVADRILRLAYRAWKAATGPQVPTFDAYVHAAYKHRDSLPPIASKYGLPTGAIIFFSYQEANFHDTDIVWICDDDMPEAYRWRRWVVMDIVAQYPHLIVPFHEPFVPYASNHARMEAALNKMDILPVWFTQTNQTVGVPVTGDIQALLPSGRSFGRCQAHTIKLKFSWPGYKPCDKQVRLLRAGQARTSVSLARLAQLVASAVHNFMGEARASGPTLGSPGQWRIGIQPGQINEHEVILLGIAFVSEGAAIPLLQVRPGFVFAH